MIRTLPEQISNSAAGFISSLAFEIVLDSHIYYHKILWFRSLQALIGSEPRPPSPGDLGLLVLTRICSDEPFFKGKRFWFRNNCSIRARCENAPNLQVIETRNS